jgi:hypothetical protein
MINNLTTLEQVTIIAQGFAKIAYNFWPAIVLGLVGVVIVARQESRAK